MLSVLSDMFMDGPFWPHLAGDAHIGESPCRRAENGGPYVCFAAPAVVVVALLGGLFIVRVGSSPQLQTLFK